MTITAAPSDLFKTQEQCIDAAANAIKDYRSTMEKVVESWLKNEATLLWRTLVVVRYTA